jgi:hypothetical protein
VRAAGRTFFLLRVRPGGLAAVWHGGRMTGFLRRLRRRLQQANIDASVLSPFPLARHEQTRVAHPQERDAEHDPFRPRLK